MGEGGSPGGGGGGGARLAHSSEKHPRAILGELSALRRHRELCDVVLNVANRKLFAHRVILSACSPYFRAMFTGELAESRATEVTIRDVDDQAMEQLVEFCYTAHIVVEESNVQALLPAACLLQLQEIQDVCCEFLKRQLDCTNCLGIRAFADTHSCRELLRIADKFTQQNFPEVMESEEFLLLPAAQLIDIVSSDELNVRSEEQTFQAVMSWVKYNVAERRQHLAQVLQHVRLPLLTPKFLVGTVSSELLVRSDDACRDLLDEAKNYLLLPQERPLMQGPRTRPRKPTRRGEVLFAVGGWCSGDAIASVERFEPQSGEWKMVAPMSKRRCGVGVAVLHDLLYAVGGHDGQSYLNSIERYDPQTNQWCGAVAPTSSCRTSVGVAVLEGALYAVGGQDGVQCLNHVERYEPKENRWTKVAAMTTRRLGVAVAVLGGALYAVGGSDGQAPLNTVERYEPRANKWTPVAPMSTRRKHLGCAVYDGQIYAVGGRDDCTELSSAERLVPNTSCINQQGASTWAMRLHRGAIEPRANKWTPVAPMSTRRKHLGCAVYDGQIYAVGGRDDCTELSSAERLVPNTSCINQQGASTWAMRLHRGAIEPRANKWTPVAPMSTRRKHLGCAVYDGQIYAVGGRDDCTELSSAERYDPAADAWSPVVAMTSRRSGVGLAVVNGQLYAVGGFDGTAYLKSIEVFDPESNQWRLCGAMNYRRLGGGVGVMRAPHQDNHYIWNRKDSVV